MDQYLDRALLADPESGMFWCDKLAQKLEGPQVVNDSKTPSGRAHVGALRGPLIHDAIFRTLKAKGEEVQFIFGCDDYDPVDEIPYGQAEHFEKYLGAPLCNVPPPPDSRSANMAEHFISEFWSVFSELGIRPDFYRMSDVYRSGKFNEVIDIILRNADVVRRIYKEISGAVRADNWYPFQVICEKCGRVGTTEVTHYDGKEVTYECRSDLVTWARGCGHRGKTSPFDGNGKLPWKLEWCAKWRTFEVTIEGAGQDHSTKGGSRQVAAACHRAIFNQGPPENCPYGFFLVGGEKMSSSKGVGATSRDMADFLPPEVLRFLMIGPAPKRPVNFEPSEKHVAKLFNDFDQCRRRYSQNEQLPEDQKKVYELSQVKPEPAYWAPDFQLLLALVQLPHLDTAKEIQKRKGSALTPLEEKHLQDRIRTVEYWLENYAGPEDRLIVQESMPVAANELTAAQRGFLQALAKLLTHAPWEDDALQLAMFDAARLTPIAQPPAFKALYRVLLNRDSGPKAGNLLSFLKREFVIERLTDLKFDKLSFWIETGVDVETFEKWLSETKKDIAAISARPEFQSVGYDLPTPTVDSHFEHGCGVIEFVATMAKGKRHCQRVLFDKFKGIDTNADREWEYFNAYAHDWLKELEEHFDLSISIERA